MRSAPETDIGLLFADNDPLASAINRTWGHGLQTVLALAAWEFRSHGTVRPEFEQTLNAVIGMVGSVGLEFRAILASHRPLLEAIAADLARSTRDSAVPGRRTGAGNLRPHRQMVPAHDVALPGVHR